MANGLQVEMMQLEVDAMQAEAASARAAAESSQAAVLEVERLAQDNALLAARLSQMDLDLQVDFLPALPSSKRQENRHKCTTHVTALPPWKSTAG